MVNILKCLQAFGDNLKSPPPPPLYLECVDIAETFRAVPPWKTFSQTSPLFYLTSPRNLPQDISHIFDESVEMNSHESIFELKSFSVASNVNNF